jgi:hypothetical protein
MFVQCTLSDMNCVDIRQPASLMDSPLILFAKYSLIFHGTGAVSMVIENQGSTPARGRELFSSPPFSDRLWDHQTFC